MQGLVLILGLLVLVCSPHVEPRVQLNSIRTVVLREGPAVPANRSSWESSLDLKLHQCMSDLECSEGSFCHIPATGPAHSRCRTCRRSGKRCLRDGMCCRDNRCLNNVCVPDAAAAQSIPDADGEMKMKGWRQRKRMNIKGASSKGQVGDPCLRSSDCSGGLCCARHFWTRICKPLLQEGQVCTRQRRKGHAGLELFQRCSCGGGLGCRVMQDPRLQPPPSSLLLAEATRSKFTASSSTFRSKSASTRLHVCQKI
ncbi:dickkopf-related protein 2 [Oryzias melastigma]|uniref:Dickkopf-related protein 2-like n=1 Tax=Oryzias melastigma TaxID=30732 RepID=A0A3B3CRP3_ORYME|nr:dickkopf-related protein 2 [Oryzias melastigma]